MPKAVAKSAGYAVSQQKRKLIEQAFGWAKKICGIAQVMVRGLKKGDQLFVLTTPGYNLTPMGTPGQIRVHGTSEAKKRKKRRRKRARTGSGIAGT